MSNNSNVKYSSNIQPVGKVVSEDRKFLSKVRDYFALDKLNRRTFGRYAFLDIQKKILRRGMKCAYSPKDEYCWGLKKDKAGNEWVFCTCLETGCKHFCECRPDFSVEELYVLKENEVESKRIKNAFSKTSKGIRNDSDEEILTKGGKSDVSGDSDLDIYGIGDTDSHNFEDEQYGNSYIEIQETIIDIGKESSDTGSGINPTDINNEIGSSDNDERSDIGFGSFRNTDQKTLIQMPPELKTVVNAGPGTGKTYTLIEKIIYMINELDIEPERILILCFSRAAVDVIKERLEQAADDGRIGHIWCRIDIRTFDSYITYLIALIMDVLPELLPSGYKLEGQNYEQRIQTGIQVIKKKPEMLDYDHVIVDEVQDLVGNRADLVLTILNSISEQCGFTILGDACQALYDYLTKNDNSQMSSAGFYEEIFSKYPDANYLALEKNYRQGDEYEKFTRPYRAAILNGDKINRANAAKTLAASINNSETSMKNLTEEEALRLVSTGSLGILTRNNGQALQISTWLKNNNVPHKLQYSLTRKVYGAWIAAIFMEYPHDKVNELEFQKCFEDMYSDMDYLPYWEALTSTQRDQDKTWFDVEELLKGILYSPKDPLLFENIESTDRRITVSNIHRAKGREFDNVLVLDDVLQQMQDPDNDDIDEHKVCYVAVTRPRKKISKFQLGGRNNFFYSLKNDEGRCFKSGKRPGRKTGYLSHIEIGKSNDILEESFAASKERQEYIRKNIKPDMGIRLKKMSELEVMHGQISYSIHLDDNPAVVLGYLGQDFKWGIVKAWRRIFKNPNASIGYSYFPDVFNNVYVERLTSCISVDTTDRPGAKTFGSMCIWTGFSITGLAHRSNNTLD